MSLVTFSPDDFASLCSEEYLGKWTNIRREDLPPSEGAMIDEFMGYLPAPIGDEPIDFDNIMAVVSENGLLSRINGPRIYSFMDLLVMKMGSNKFPVEQVDGGFRCGKLVGDLTVADKQAKFNSGEGGELRYWPGAVEFYVGESDDPDQIYKIPLAVNPESGVNPAQMRSICRKNEPLARILKQLNDGGGEQTQTQNLAVLPLGEYQVVSAKEVDTKNGPSWVITLADKRQFWVKGLVKKVLENGFEVSPELQTTLAIKKQHKPDAQGRIFTDCALFRRWPKQAAESPTADPGNQPPARTMGVMKGGKPGGAKTPAPGNRASRLGATEPVEEVDYDSIPY